MPLMNLTRDIMKRSRLIILYLYTCRTKLTLAQLLISSNENYWASFLRKTKKNIYASVDEKYVAINKQFWRTVRP